MTSVLAKLQAKKAKRIQIDMINAQAAVNEPNLGKIVLKQIPFEVKMICNAWGHYSRLVA